MLHPLNLAMCLNFHSGQFGWGAIAADNPPTLELADHPWGNNRVIRWIDGLEFAPGIGLGDLTGDFSPPRTINPVGMALKTYFILETGSFNLSPRPTDSRNETEGIIRQAGSDSSPGGSGKNVYKSGMGIMTILAFNVAGHGSRIFVGIVSPGR